VSRTYKEKPWKFQAKFLENEAEQSKYWYTKIVTQERTKTGPFRWEWVELDPPREQQSYFWLDNAGVKTKKKRYDNEDKWYYGMYSRAPSWHTRMYMNRPARRAAHLKERQALFCDLDEFDFYVEEDDEFVYYW
jgi:hypothetical protein